MSSTDSTAGSTFLSIPSKELIEEEIKQDSKGQWILYKGVEYDCSEYMPLHPGGKMLLEGMIG